MKITETAVIIITSYLVIYGILAIGAVVALLLVWLETILG